MNRNANEQEIYINKDIMNKTKNDLNHPSCYEQLKSYEKETLDEWIKAKFEKSKNTYTKRSSYGLKHDFQRKTGIYVYNGAFKGGMLKAGFEAEDEIKINWYFKIKERIADSFWGFCVKWDNSVVEDFVKDVIGDYSFPKELTDKAKIKTYLYRRGACKEAMKAFEVIWKYYNRKNQ